MGDAPGSPGASDASSSASEMSITTARSLGEGDLITGTVDYVNERAHIVPPVENWDRAYGKNREVRAYLHLVDRLTKCIRFHQEKHILSLQIIPQEYQDEWTLNHPSNAIWRTIYRLPSAAPF